MGKFSIIFSVFFAIWFLLCDQWITIQAASIDSESYEEKDYDEVLVSNDTNSFSNNTSFIQNSTTIHSETETLESLDDDIIELNVGGERITTLRSTLTVIPNSTLAIMFTKDNQSISQAKDNTGSVFFDYNPVQFKYLLDQLRMMKRMPERRPYENNFQAPNADIRSNFSDMISDLGLSPDQFLSPLTGVHQNVTIKSLIGWQECHRDTYDKPFDLLPSMKACRSRRLLVACRPADDNETLTLAGVGQWQELFFQCSSNTHCTTDLKNDIGFYHVENQTWGFAGRPRDYITTNNQYGYNNYNSNTGNSFNLNPCDTSDQYSGYRLCWSLRSNANRGGGDRCGNMKNLHNSISWERIIYQAV